MFGCSDLRKRWNHLVGKPANEAVAAIKNDGEQNIEVFQEGTPQSYEAIRSGFVRVITDENGNVKYPPLRQD